MKIVMMSECEWYIGESLDACLIAYKDDTGLTDEDIHLQGFEPRELSDAALESIMFQPTEKDETPTGPKISFAEAMRIEIADAGKFPRFFAATE